MTKRETKTTLPAPEAPAPAVALQGPVTLPGTPVISYALPSKATLQEVKTISGESVLVAVEPA